MHKVGVRTDGPHAQIKFLKHEIKQKRFRSFFFFFKLGFTPCKAKQTLRGMKLQEKKHNKGYRLQKIFLERTYS